MWGITPVDQLICRIQFRKAYYEGFYTRRAVIAIPSNIPATTAVRLEVCPSIHAAA